LPGIAIGYRVAVLVAVVENKFCAVNTIQAINGFI
jgi:formylmethanofuran dehydrogenase subunit E